MKCLRAYCEDQPMLLNLGNIFEVSEATDLQLNAVHSEGDFEALKTDWQKGCFANVVWRETQISFINLVGLMSEGRQMNFEQCVVTASSTDIEKAAFDGALMVGLGSIDQIVDVEDEWDERRISFDEDLLRNLISNVIYDEAGELIQLYLNLPLSLPSLLAAMHGEEHKV